MMQAALEDPMLWLWIGFVAFVLMLLALDLGVFHRKAHVVGLKEALAWSGVWMGVALVFNLFVYVGYEHHWLGMGLPGTEPDGQAAAVMYFTGYVLEKSLSVDNVFVMALIFSYFGVPAVSQHRVLFWGILGALVMRGGMILLGSVLIARFHWVLYVFGAFMIFAAAKMLLVRHEPDPRNTWLVRFARRWFPVTGDFAGQRFAVRANGQWLLTPLALALVAVESTDLLFAVDSVPAIFAVTEDPFLVFTSNVFAMLGLRSLYFALAGILDRFYYLKLSLVVLLALIGVKMLLKDVLHAVPGLTYYTLGVIALVLTAGVVASLLRAQQGQAENGRTSTVVPIAGARVAKGEMADQCR
jgi:tellurite resistance protein TerC